MTDGSSEDRDLRDAFARLREHDRTRTPDAASMLARARAEAARLAAAGDDASARPTGGARTDDLAAARARLADPSARPAARRRGFRWALPGLSVALAAGLAAIVLVKSGGDDEADFDRVVQAWAETGGAWRAPTDDLLRMPGDEILRTVPRIGGARPPTPREPDASPLDGPGRESPS